MVWSEAFAGVGVAWALAWVVVRYLQLRPQAPVSSTSYMDVMVERERTIRECALRGVPVPVGAVDESDEEG
jgi:hypothetical protein